jgi:hypothetical protein
MPVYRYLLLHWPLATIDSAIESHSDFHVYLRGLSDQKKMQLFQVFQQGYMSGQIPRDNIYRHLLYGSTTRELAKTRARNRNRRRLTQQRLVTPGDALEIHHTDGNAMNNDASNLVILTKCQHREVHGRACHQ